MLPVGGLAADTKNITIHLEENKCFIIHPTAVKTFHSQHLDFISNEFAK